MPASRGTPTARVRSGIIESETVGMPLASSTRCTSPTDRQQNGHAGTSAAASTPSSRISLCDRRRRLLDQHRRLEDVAHDRVVPGRRLPDDAFLCELGQPPHRQHHVEVGLAEPRVDVQVIQPNVPFRRAERNDPETGIAPPRIAPLALLIEGPVVPLRATPAVETSAMVHSPSGFVSGVNGIDRLALAERPRLSSPGARRSRGSDRSRCSSRTERRGTNLARRGAWSSGDRTREAQSARIRAPWDFRPDRPKPGA